MEAPTESTGETPVSSSKAAVLAGRAVRRYSAAELLVVLVSWLVTAPVVRGLKQGPQIEAALAAAVQTGPLLPPG